MELSNENHIKQTEFIMVLASGIIILSFFSFGGVIPSYSNPSTIQTPEIFQLDINDTFDAIVDEGGLDPFITNKYSEIKGIVAYNQITDTFILQSTTGREYILQSTFADFIELVGENVTVGGDVTNDTINVTKIIVE